MPPILTKPLSSIPCGAPKAGMASSNDPPIISPVNARREKPVMACPLACLTRLSIVDIHISVNRYQLYRIPTNYWGVSQMPGTHHLFTVTRGLLRVATLLCMLLIALLGLVMGALMLAAIGVFHLPIPANEI